MALVSGRPISFQMDLYTPLYVPRPTVVPELFASLRPVTYNGNLTPALTSGLFDARSGATREKFDKDAKGAKLDQLKEMDGALRSLRESVDTGTNAATTLNYAYDTLNLHGAGVSTMATATKLGDFFQYALDKPVSLPRQKSALLPIINKDVEGTRVSIYNERTQAKFPLLGLKFKNTSGMHLSQGPITVFEGSNYAGDSRILDVEPNEERLLSYAVDLGMEVNPVLASDNGRFTTIRYNQGLLYTATKDVETKTYTIANRNTDERLVVIEHPVRNQFHLTSADKPTETASDVYRFEVKVPAGKTKVQTVTEEHDGEVLYHLTDLDDAAIVRFQSAPVTSAAMKKGLQKALELRWAVQKTQREIAEQQLQLKTITEDQARLRANLKEMPPTAAAYKRYLEKFDQQETQIEKYQADIKKMQETEHQQQKEFEDFLNNFSAE
jgi:hypothetical protein